MTKEGKYMLAAIAAIVAYRLYKKNQVKKSVGAAQTGSDTGPDGGGGSQIIVIEEEQPINKAMPLPNLRPNIITSPVITPPGNENTVDADGTPKTESGFSQEVVNADAEKTTPGNTDKAVNTFTGSSDKIGLYTHVRKVTGKTFQI